LGAYSKFVEATNRYSSELRALLVLMLHRNRRAQSAYPSVLQDSTAIAVCQVARARQHRIFRDWARKAKNGMGWWYGFKLHGQWDESGRLCGFDLTTATVDDRKLLEPLTRWRQDGIVVGDGGSLSQAKARDLAQRGVYWLTPTRKHMRHLASQFQVACLPYPRGFHKSFWCREPDIGRCSSRETSDSVITVTSPTSVCFFPSSSRMACKSKARSPALIARSMASNCRGVSFFVRTSCRR
jgi:hypothetical protein